MPRKGIAVHASLSSIQIVKEQTAKTVPADRFLSQPPEAHRPGRTCPWNIKKPERKSGSRPTVGEGGLYAGVLGLSTPVSRIRRQFFVAKNHRCEWLAPNPDIVTRRGGFKGHNHHKYSGPADIATKRTHSHGIDALCMPLQPPNPQPVGPESDPGSVDNRRRSTPRPETGPETRTETGRVYC